MIKVEAPGRGDLARQLGQDPELNARNMGVSFLAQNAGKNYTKEFSVSLGPNPIIEVIANEGL